MLTMRALTAAVLAGVVGVAGFARPAPGQDEHRMPGAAQPEQPKAPDLVVTVDFPGGTVGQYIDALKKAAGRQAVNVVTSRAATEVPIGPISLREVSVFTALSAISTAAGRDTIWNVKPLAAPMSKAIEGYALEFAPQQPGPRMVVPSDTSIQVFSLRDLIEPLPGDPPGVPLTKPPEVVLTAVKASLDLLGDRAAQPDMKFHEDSGLLIIHGTGEQIGAVSQALSQMRDDVRRRRDAARASMQPHADLDQMRMEVDKAAVMHTQAMRSLERANTDLERVRKLAEAGQAPQAEVGDAEAKVDDLKARVELTSIDLDRTKIMLKSAEAGGGGPTSPRAEDIRRRLAEIDDKIQKLNVDLHVNQAKGGNSSWYSQQIGELQIERRQLQAQFDEAVKGGGGGPPGGPETPQGKSVAVYDLPPMDAKSREQLISSIKALEAAINSPERLKLQSIQGDSKLVIEADGAMHAVVRGMIQEVAGGRTREPDKSGKDSGGGRPPKPAGR
jgi:hypothetical protein